MVIPGCRNGNHHRQHLRHKGQRTGIGVHGRLIGTVGLGIGKLLSPFTEGTFLGAVGTDLLDATEEFVEQSEHSGAMRCHDALHLTDVVIVEQDEEQFEYQHADAHEEQRSAVDEELNEQDG